MSLRGYRERKSWKRGAVAAVAGWWPVSWFASWREEKHCPATCSETPAEETQVLATTWAKILTFVPKVSESGFHVAKVFGTNMLENAGIYRWTYFKCRGAYEMCNT